MCKAAEKAMVERLILGNHNTELQEAASQKKERNSRKGGNLSKADARVYDAQSLIDRANWSNEKLEEELVAQFMKMSLTIFDFKEKPLKKISSIPHGTNLHLGPATTLPTLFQSPIKSTSPQKAAKPTNPLKLTKPTKSTKARAAGVKKRGANKLTKVVVMAYGGGKRGEGIGAKIKDIIEIKSSHGRMIKPTAKRVVIKKK
jgi:hypothetical protein